MQLSNWVEVRVQKKYDVAIIGAGPAGVTTAIQLQRFGIRFLLFEQSRIGGLLNNAYLVENYPGFPKGIAGMKLARKFKQHLEKQRINIIKEQVIKVTKNRDHFILHAKKIYQAAILVVASGTKPKLPELDLRGFRRKIFFEVYPIRNTRNKTIVIVGVGDAALDYALNLSRHNRIIILNRDEKIKGLDLLFKRIRRLSANHRTQIRYFKNIKVLIIKQLNNCLIIKVLKKRKKAEMVCSYIVFAIGRQPAIDFLAPAIRKKFPEGDSKKIHFIGDVRHGNFRQTAIAVGDGIQAAMKIHQYLQTQKPQG